MAKKRYDYKVFPQTTKARILVAVAFVAGLALTAGYFVYAFAWWAPGPFAWFDAWDKIEVTYVNETEDAVVVYLDDDVVATVQSGGSVTHTYRKVQWWFNRRVVARSQSGLILFATEADSGDLKEMDYKIEIRLTVGVSASESALACAVALYPVCLEAQDALSPGAVESCVDSDDRVCIAPLGLVSPELVRHLVDHYQDQYGLTVSVLTPSAIPERLLNGERAQVDAHDLLTLIQAKFGQNPGTVVIGLTSVDMYISTQDWRYAFGLLDDFNGVISTIRMNSASYGEESNPDLLSSRARKLVSKYIGLLHYGLPLSSDPESAMYNNILGPGDLDRITEPLPVALN